MGTVTGVLRDESGAVAPGASVVLTNANTGIGVTVQSQSDGTYVVPQVQPGRYRIAVTLKGFKSVTIDELTVNVGSTLTQDITLQLGAVTDRVEVVAASVTVETTNGTVGTTVQVAQVLEMPLVDRNVFRLTNLVPGAFYNDRGVSLGLLL